MGVSALTPLITKVVVDQVVAGGEGSIAPWLVALMGIAVVTFIGAYVRRYVGGRVSLDVQYDLRNADLRAAAAPRLRPPRPLQTGQLVSPGDSRRRPASRACSRSCPIMLGNLVLLVVALVVMAGPVAAAHAGRAGRRSRRSLIVALRLRATVVPGDAGTPSSGPARWPASSTRRSPACGWSRASGRSSASSATWPTTRRRLFRVAGAARAPAGPLHADAADASRRSAQVAVLALGGWLAIDGRITPRHVPRLLDLPRPAGGAGADARRRCSRSAQQARAGAERILDVLDATRSSSSGPTPDR